MPIKHRVKQLLRERTPARGRMTRAEREGVRRYLARDIQRFAEEFSFNVEQWGF